MATGVLLASLALIGIALAFLFGRHCEAIERRLRALEEKAASAPEAHSHRTVAGIEDATAVVIDLLFEVEAEHARLESLRQILGAVRQGPYNYDPERPCGKRQ